MEQRKERKRNLRRTAYAKVNLFLEILDKRDDGFHNIRTVFSEISLSDEIIFALTKNQGIKIWSFPEIVKQENNIIYRVAVFIKDEYGVKDGVEIRLKKNIPHQAGLGGGSSDAATTVKALNELWNLGLTKNEMHKIALRFGSDINFFLEGGSAIGYGRGELIEPIDDILIENIVLIKPKFGISTKEAYNLVNEHTVSRNWDKFLETKDVKYCFNAFEESLLEKYPEINKIYKIVESFNAKPLLSGSGSTVIAFCKSLKDAKEIKEIFANKYWTYITKTMRRRK